MEVFLSSNELYLFRLLDSITESVNKMYTSFAMNYNQVAQIVFYVFLAIQLVTLFYLRRLFIQHLRKDVMQSRGILNLIPQSFIKNHQEVVERVIKLMRK
jgi:hypothetical protein